VDAQRRDIIRFGFNPRAHLRQRRHHPAHRAFAERSIANQGAVECLSGQ